MSRAPSSAELVVGKRPIRKRRSGAKGALTARHGPSHKSSRIELKGKVGRDSHPAPDTLRSSSQYRGLRPLDSRLRENERRSCVPPILARVADLLDFV